MTLTGIFQVDIQKELSPEETVIQNEKEAAIWKSLAQLDEHYRIVVILRYFHQLSITEISQILAIPEGTVHSRLHSAREKLRTALRDLHGE
jgi:RNA polymerase sigma-70 factor (ECF subfamily)